MKEESEVKVILDEIIRRLETIESKLGVMDINIKNIANSAKLSELINSAKGTLAGDWARAIPKSERKPSVKQVEEPNNTGFKNFNFQSSDASKDPNRKQSRSRKQSKIVVKGKMVTNFNGKNTPLSSISVEIYDDKDNLVKTTKTNRAGQWMSHLAPGKYVALFNGELNGKKLQPQNRVFEVPESLPEGQFDIRVI